MAVGVQRNLDAGVPQALRYDFRMDVRQEQDGGRSVPQVMESYQRQFRLADQGAEGSLGHVRPSQPAAMLITEDRLATVTFRAHSTTMGSEGVEGEARKVNPPPSFCCFDFLQGQLSLYFLKASLYQHGTGVPVNVIPLERE